MGKRSDRRRREQQRARQRARQARSRSAGSSAAGSTGAAGLGSEGAAGAAGAGWSAGVVGGRTFTPDLVDDVIDYAVSSRCARRARDLDNAVTVLAAGPSGPEGPALVDRALGRWLVETVGHTWGLGWQPTDLARVVERELGRVCGRLCAEAVVRETQRYEPTAVPGRWRAQVDDLDVGHATDAAPATGVTGDGAGGAHDGRWAVAGQGRDRPSAVRAVVEILAFLGRLPAVPKLGPAPGDLPVGGGEQRGGVDPRILHRVRSLLAKAESTTFPDEAESLTAKAQELMARHAIDTAVVEAERGTGPRVSARRVAVDDPYAAAKAMLLEAIASANRCRSVWSKGFGYATVFGDEGDLDAVELLYTSLLVQAARAMLAEGPSRGRSSGRTRSFRQSFLVAFATRIGVRLREAVDTATDAYADRHATLLPVLADRREAADAACDETFPRVRATSVSANDMLGWQAGNEAADAAQLDVHAPVPTRSTA